MRMRETSLLTKEPGQGDSQYSEPTEGSYHGYHYSPDQKEEEPYQPAWFEQEGGGAQD